MKEKIQIACENAATSIDELSKSLNSLLKNSTVYELVETFEFESLIEVNDAIDYYENLEMYNCCQALDIIMNRELNLIVNESK